MTRGPAEATRVMETDLFGRDVRFQYAEHWVGYSVFLLRIVMGWTMLWAGIDKLREGVHGFLVPDWSAAGYLASPAVSPDNPFKQMFVDMAGSSSVDFLVVWGLTLTGIGLLLGLFLRLSAFFAAVMMIFFWLSAWQGWFRLAHGWVVDDHIVYAVLLFGLGAFGAGRLLGLDARIERHPVVKKNPWLTYLLG